MRVLVTGGGGFLGLAVVRKMLDRGHEVESLSRSTYPELKSLGVTAHTVDLGQKSAGLDRAVAGKDCVIHCAAKAGVFGPAAGFERANHLGTLHLLDAAKRAGVERFVHTSSPSVCFDGKDHIDAKGDLPYATRFLSPYPKSKAAAEKAVLAAHTNEGMRTVALRPHLIFGPGDPHILPRLLARARAGKLMRVGPGDNQVSLTYIDNAAMAHVVAAENLTPQSSAGGRAYFVGQQEPVRLWDWIGEVLAALDIAPIKKQLSQRAAYRLGWLCEGAYRMTRRRSDPPMSRFVALQLSTSHSYDLEPLIRDLGYAEQVPLAEATARTIAAFRTTIPARSGQPK